MFFLMLVFSALASNAHIIPSVPTDTVLNSAPIPPTESYCPNQRSVWDITWSCLATVFACAWVAVHPDVPHPESTWWQNTRRRLELMFWTIITPELIVFWAARQWYGARRIENAVSSRFKAKWTRKHAHFAQMGGFTLFDGNNRIRTLEIWDIQNFSLKGHIRFPKTPLKDIEDRSKSDTLAKVLVVGQTTWFIIQVVARAVQGLVVTEIEIATLAFAALNAVMYFFWWDKPMDVQSSIPVYLIGRPPVEGEGSDEESIRPDVVLSSQNVLSIVQSSCAAVIREAPRVLGRFSSFISDGFRAMINNHSERLEFSSIYRGPTESGPLRVPLYYAVDVDDRKERIINILVALSGVIFGAIHCLCWSFTFPSHAERTIWRACALLISIVPALGGAFFAITGAHLLAMYGTSTLAWGFRMLIPFYFSARVLLIVEALITLRDLPTGAFDVVQWTTFIPHI